MRGKLNSQTGAAHEHMGDVHASIVLHDHREVTVDFICEKLAGVFSSDDLGEFSAAKLKEEYQRMIVAQKAQRATARMKTLLPVTERFGFKITVSDALRAVGDDSGPFNWVTLGSIDNESLDLFN